MAGLGQRQAEVDKLFAAFNTHTPGCAVGVMKQGKLEFSTGYGMADLERGVPIGPGTVFENGSIAKQFTAATLMLLEQQGKLSLDDAMGKYLPELQGPMGHVTIRQVISHISGIRDWRQIATMGGRREGTYVYANEDLLEMARRQKALNFDAGSQYSYSNLGYNIAVILVERVLGGKSFEQYTREQIFAPLGMSETSWRSRFRRIVPGRALAYGLGEGGVREQDTLIENIIGAGGMLTTVGFC
jgi:CubicO group peptidase (beta-lactamase class C family)